MTTEHSLQIQREKSIDSIRACISATENIRVREGFGQTVIPAPGSVVASPFHGNWNPEPDYFFNWPRDAAIIMKAVIDLSRHAEDRYERAAWNGMLDDYVDFNLGLVQLDGNDFVPNPLRATAMDGCQQYVRKDEYLKKLVGAAMMQEARFNPDGTPNLIRWDSPQNDGPALRALTCLEYYKLGQEQGRAPSDNLVTLIKKDLDFTATHADKICIGPWEEPNEFDHHYFTSLCQLGALFHGAEWATERDEKERGQNYRDIADAVRRNLDAHWSDELQVYKALRNRPDETADQAVDAAIFMAVLHAELPDGTHSLQDPKVHATVRQIEDYFARAYPINQGRGPGEGIMIGRNARDKFFSAEPGGNPWFPTTFSLAEFHYRSGNTEAAETTLLNAMNYIPADNSLSEQFQRATGTPVSAKELGWSHAAFLGAVAAREAAHAASPLLRIEGRVDQETQPGLYG